MKKKYLFNSFFLFVCLVFIYFPIIILILFSFNKSDSLRFFSGFSFKWYGELFSRQELWRAFLTTFLIAVSSSIVSLIIGILASLAFLKINPHFRKISLSIANVPLINPDIVTGATLMLVFLILGFKFGLFTLFLSHLSFNVPYVIFLIYPRIKKLNVNFFEAALDLGVSYFYIIRHLILPAIKKTVFLAFIIAFSMSFDDFVISYFNSGYEENISVYFYTLKHLKPFINAFSALLFFIFLIGVIFFRFSYLFIFFIKKFFLYLINSRKQKFPQTIENLLDFNTKKNVPQRSKLLAKIYYSKITRYCFFFMMTTCLLLSSWFLHNRFFKYDLVIANWGDYTNYKLLRDFENDNKIKIKINEFASNEELEMKLLANKYDLFVPSEYKAKEFLTGGLIDKNYNFSLSKNIINQELEKYFAAKNRDGKKLLHVFPYFYGKLILVIGPDYLKHFNSFKKSLSVKKEDQKIWEKVFELIKKENKLRFLINNDLMNIFMMGLFGWNLESNKELKKVSPTNYSDIENIVDYLKRTNLLKRKNTLKLDDEIVDYLKSGKFDIALVNNGDYLKAYLDNEQERQKDIFFNEEIYTSYWVDVFAVSQGSYKEKKKENIDKFLDFLKEKPNQKSLVKELKYNSPLLGEEDQIELFCENENCNNKEKVKQIFKIQDNFKQDKLFRFEDPKLIRTMTEIYMKELI